MKADTGMNSCHLKGSQGDGANAVLAAIGFNFRLILKWLAALLRALIAIAGATLQALKISPSVA